MALIKEKVRKVVKEKLDHLPTPKLFRALCDPNRMVILKSLCEEAKSHNVKAIAKYCQVDLSVVSRHLALMKESKILKAEKVGKEVFYSVNGTSLVKALRTLADYIEKSVEQAQQPAQENSTDGDSDETKETKETKIG